MVELRTGLERGVDEAVGRSVDLALSQRPELNGLQPSRQGIRQPLEAQHLGRPGKQETPRPLVDVDSVLEREEELGRSLHLVDEQQPVVAQETHGIGAGRREHRGIVQPPFHRRRGATQDEPSERALADLARAVDEDHPGVGERRSDQLLGVPGQEWAQGLLRGVHVGSVPDLPLAWCRICRWFGAGSAALPTRNGPGHTP